MFPHAGVCSIMAACTRTSDTCLVLSACWRVLARAGVCWPMLVRAGACWRMLARAGTRARSRARATCPRMLGYVAACKGTGDGTNFASATLCSGTRRHAVLCYLGTLLLPPPFPQATMLVCKTGWCACEISSSESGVCNAASRCNFGCGGNGGLSFTAHAALQARL